METKRKSNVFVVSKDFYHIFVRKMMNFDFERTSKRNERNRIENENDRFTIGVEFFIRSKKTGEKRTSTGNGSIHKRRSTTKKKKIDFIFQFFRDELNEIRIVSRRDKTD